MRGAGTRCNLPNPASSISSSTFLVVLSSIRNSFLPSSVRPQHLLSSLDLPLVLLNDQLHSERSKWTTQRNLNRRKPARRDDSDRSRYDRT